MLWLCFTRHYLGQSFIFMACDCSRFFLDAFSHHPFSANHLLTSITFLLFSFRTLVYPTLPPATLKSNNDCVVRYKSLPTVIRRSQTPFPNDTFASRLMDGRKVEGVLCASFCFLSLFLPTIYPPKKNSHHTWIIHLVAQGAKIRQINFRQTREEVEVKKGLQNLGPS